LAMIVFSSICLGAILPIILEWIGVDPAHSSTTIQGAYNYEWIGSSFVDYCLELIFEFRIVNSDYGHLGSNNRGNGIARSLGWTTGSISHIEVGRCILKRVVWASSEDVRKSIVLTHRKRDWQRTSGLRDCDTPRKIKTKQWNYFSKFRNHGDALLISSDLIYISYRLMHLLKVQ
jgi:hypothetical protein